MRNLKVELKGFKEFPKSMEKYRKRAWKLARTGLGEACEWYLKNADWTVPLDTGALRASGNYFIEDFDNGRNFYAVLGYGFDISDHENGVYVDENGVEKVPSEYAVLQHEIPYNHPRGGIDHYLEEGLAYYLDEMSKIIRNEVYGATP